MKHRIVSILAALMLLSGCGKSRDPVQKALDFRTALMQAGGCSFEADITADYTDKLYDFTVSVEFTPEQTELTVIAPESIRGISACVTQQGTELEFDGAELAFGKLANGFVSPVTAPRLLGDSWLGAYISASGADGELERVTYLEGYAEQTVTLDTWLDESGMPVYAEVTYDDRRCLTIQIRDFSFN